MRNVVAWIVVVTAKFKQRKIDITQGWGVLQSLISPSKGNEKKKKKKKKKEVITTRGIRSWSLIQVRTLPYRA